MQVQTAIKLKGQTTKFSKKLGMRKVLKSIGMQRKKAKKAVSNVKRKAYDDLYNRLNTKEDEKTYKLAKLRERKTKDFNYIIYVKGED